MSYLLIVVLGPVIGPVSTAGYMMSIVVALIGAAAGVYGMRQFVKSKPVPVSARRR